MKALPSNISIIDACNNPKIWASWFKKNPASWEAWFAFLKTMFGLPMTANELAIYSECTSRTTPTQGGTTEAWLICGRRSGKSFTLALIAVYLAIFRDWSNSLSPGERGTIMILACDKKQSGTIFRYAKALIARVPSLAQLIQRTTNEEIVLSNAISIEITTASFRTIRGRTVICGLLDEAAYYRSEDSANPDREILDALRPAMATVPGAVLLVASSPYSRRGIVWDAHKRHFGKDNGPLVWQAPTRRMNPSVPQSFIDEQYERDPASAAAEYGALFRTDCEALLTIEIVEAVTIPGRHELPRMSGVQYCSYTDQSGGSSDSSTIAITHREKDGRVVLDAVRERRPPFSPEAIVQEFAALLKSYGVSRVMGDRYAGEWPRERFRTHGIQYDLSEQSASDYYRDALVLFNSSGKIELLDNQRLVTQFVSLERRTSRSGKDLISHPPHCHDDLANAVAGALVLADKASSSLYANLSPGAIARMSKPYVPKRPTLVVPM